MKMKNIINDTVFMYISFIKNYEKCIDIILKKSSKQDDKDFRYLIKEKNDIEIHYNNLLNIKSSLKGYLSDFIKCEDLEQYINIIKQKFNEIDGTISKINTFITDKKKVYDKNDIPVYFKHSDFEEFISDYIYYNGSKRYAAKIIESLEEILDQLKETGLSVEINFIHILILLSIITYIVISCKIFF